MLSAMSILVGTSRYLDHRLSLNRHLYIGLWLLRRMSAQVWECKCLAVLHRSVWLSYIIGEQTTSKSVAICLSGSKQNWFGERLDCLMSLHPTTANHALHFIAEALLNRQHMIADAYKQVYEQVTSHFVCAGYHWWTDPLCSWRPLPRS